MARPKKRRMANGSVSYFPQRDSWRYRYWIGDKRIVKYAKTSKEAHEKLSLAKSLIADGHDLALDPKFSEYAENWINLKVSMGSHTPKTTKSNINNVNHISEYIGDKKLSQIKPTHLEYAYTDLLEKGLSKSSVNQIHRTVSSIWNHALKKGIVRVNVPANSDAPASEKRIPTILERNDWIKIIMQSETEDDGVIIHFLLMTGMRIDKECLSLTWNQIDFDNGNVTVGESKTDAGSFRTIPLPTGLLQRLKERKLDQESRFDTKNPLAKFNPNNLVFCNTFGNRHSKDNLRRGVWKRIKQVTGIQDRTTFHDLRHNAGSYLLSEGVPVTTVSKILGHADPSITMKIYAHELQEDKESVRVAMSKFSTDNS